MDDTTGTGPSPQPPLQFFADGVNALTSGEPHPAAGSAPASGGDRLTFVYKIDPATVERFKAAVAALFAFDQDLTIRAGRAELPISVSSLAEEALAASAGFYEGTSLRAPALAAAIGSRPTNSAGPTIKHQRFNITPGTANRIAAVAASNGVDPSDVAAEALVASATWYENQLNAGREFAPTRLSVPPRSADRR